jgi:predicted AAA+ superfamily ATPase
MIVVAGPRQIGKTTMVRQALVGHPHTFEATDQPAATIVDPFDAATDTIQTEPAAKATEKWIVDKWVQARAKARSLPSGKCHVLVIDEIQKIPRWSEVIKGLWDADRAANVPLHVVLLGSSPWLMQKGLTESLAGRYESIHMSHWSYGEMQEAFDFSLDEYIYFGGYPGAAHLIRDESRWRQYVRDSLIKPNIENDILQMTRVEKPALLKGLFNLGCHYSGQILGLNKVLKDFEDKGHTVTLKHYLDLLSKAGLLTGLQKYGRSELGKRDSMPKFNAHNTALISALATYSFEQAKNDRTYWGRLVESAIGSHLINNKPESFGLYYWRENSSEVDFVLNDSEKLLAIEVKSGDDYVTPKGLQTFTDHFQNKKVIKMVVGAQSIPIPDFLRQPIDQWMK